MDFNVLYAIPLFLIAIVYPVYAIAMGKKDKDILLEHPSKKVYVYKLTALIQAVLLFLILIGFMYNKDSLDLIGLSYMKNPFWVMALVTVVVLGFFVLSNMKIPSTKAKKIRNQFSDVMYIVPTTMREYKWAIVMSVIVGAFEEVIFRGFLFWKINEYMHFIVAIIITNIIFGLCHYGTGLKNTMTAICLGLFWSVIYYLTDSLWLPIFGHILIDMHSSILAKKIFIDIKDNE